MTELIPAPPFAVFFTLFQQDRSLQKAPPCAKITELIPVGFFFAVIWRW